MGVMSKQAFLLFLLLVLLKLGSLPLPLCQEVSFGEWSKSVPTNVGKDAGCAAEDAALSSVDSTFKVNNFIDPTTQRNPEDGEYKTISESIANIPDGSTKRYILTLKAGTVFREKVFLNKSKPFVTIRSDDPNNPAIIVWNDTATTPDKNGKPLGVDGSSTVTIESDYFVAYGIVFKNDAPLPKPRENKGEAPALRVLGTKATFYNCTIEGGQGSLYDQKGLHYFKLCTIKGTIDFIFGFAKSFYEDCYILAMNKEAFDLPMVPLQDHVDKKGFFITYPIKAAPGEGGFSFKTCTIKGDGESIYLGRLGSPIIYSFTQIDKKIVPILSDERNVLKTERGIFSATFKCYGPGVAASTTYAMEYAQAKPFIGTHYISGDSWIPLLPPVSVKENHALTRCPKVT